MSTPATRPLGEPSPLVTTPIASRHIRSARTTPAARPAPGQTRPLLLAPLLFVVVAVASFTLTARAPSTAPSTGHHHEHTHPEEVAFDAGTVDGFLPVWPPCSTVDVIIDDSVPADLAPLVANETDRVLRLAGTEPGDVRRDNLQLDNITPAVELISFGSLAVGIAEPDELGVNQLGVARTTTYDDGLVAVVVLINGSVRDHTDFVAVLRHELGHAVGLPHTDDPTQLMHPTNTPQTPDDFTSKELESLNDLMNRPCRWAAPLG